MSDELGDTYSNGRVNASVERRVCSAGDVRYEPKKARSPVHFVMPLSYGAAVFVVLKSQRAMLWNSQRYVDRSAGHVMISSLYPQAFPISPHTSAELRKKSVSVPKYCCK